MNNKGITLVELLAIIVVLSIVLLIAVPSIGNVLEDSRIRAFLAEAQGVYRVAKVKALDVAEENGGIISNSVNSLDVDSNELTYCVKVDSEGNITSITVSDGKYIVSGTSDFASQSVDTVSLGNMDSFVCS